MKKLISSFCVLIVLAFSFVVPCYAANLPLKSADLSSDGWAGWGTYDFVSRTVYGVKYNVLSVPYQKTATRQLWITPTTAGNKFVFTFRVVCDLSASTTGHSRAYFVYVDGQTGEELILWDSDKLTNYDTTGNLITVTLVFPDTFGASGSLNFRVENNTMQNFVCGIVDLSVSDMTYAGINSAVDKNVEGIGGIGSDEPALDTDISVFQSAIDTMNGWLDQLDEFADSISSAGQTAHEYISKGTELFNGFMGVAPAAVIALIGFGIVFLVVRKIVGR